MNAVSAFCRLALVAGAAFFVSVASGYGVDVPKALANRTVESTCVPLNARMWRMRQPDGRERLFLSDADNPHLLRVLGGGPWYGVIRPELGLVNVRTNPDFKGPPTEFCFAGGHLRFMTANGKDHAFDPASYAAPTSSVTALWPREVSSVEWSKMNMWRASGRLRFLSNNPNRSALPFAQLALIALGVLLFARSRAFRAHAALWTLIFLALLLQTASRGGLLAFAVGAVGEVAVWLARAFSWRRFAVAAGVAILFAGMAWALKSAIRIDSVLEGRDVSADSRLHIWREFPKMLAVAPWGWGPGRSGFSYNEWFEREDRHHSVGDLFNDHFSRVAEWGVVGGAAYAFLWLAALGFFARAAIRGASPAPLAAGLALAIAGAFNPMASWGWAWVLPVVTTAFALVRDRRACRAALAGSAWLWLGAAGLAALAIGGTWAVGACQGHKGPPLDVSALGRRVAVGRGAPGTWYVDDGTVLDGEYPGFLGRQMRALYAANPEERARGFVQRVQDAPRAVDTLVLAGKSGSAYLAMPEAERPRTRRLVFLSPPFGPSAVPEALRESKDVHFVYGEFAARLLRFSEEERRRAVVVPGAELFVPGWEAL